MKSKAEIVESFIAQEKATGIYNISIYNLPIWRIYRSKIIDDYMYQQLGKEKRDTRKKSIPATIFITYLSSFYQIMISLFKQNKFHNVIFSFPRLHFIGGTFMDKLTDPIIQLTKLKNSTLVFQKSYTGKHKRKHSPHSEIIFTDFIDYTALFLGFIYLPFILLKHQKSLNRIKNRGKRIFGRSMISTPTLARLLAVFLIKTSIYKFLFKKMRAKRILLVNREICYPQIVAAKNLNILSLELQHGVTHGTTVLYSGQYSQFIDPDYFLTFGEYWRGSQFGMPVNRLLNIGWAYTSLLNDEKQSSSKLSDHNVLVISEPTYSHDIFIAVKAIAETFPDFNFDIRLHPQEEYDKNDKEILISIRNMRIIDNSEDSSVSVQKYKYVLGHNSSVLYEGLSQGKAVACLNMHGLTPHALEKELTDFFIITNVDDFKNFIYSTTKEQGNSFYSEFKIDYFNWLIS